VLRNVAVPAATVGPTLSMLMFIFGGMLAVQGIALGKLLIIGGLLAFSALVVFQLINLPVEFDASARAKRLLPELGIVDHDGAAVVRGVLNAAAMTYVAATLQAILTLLYLVIRYGGLLGRSNDD